MRNFLQCLLIFAVAVVPWRGAWAQQEAPPADPHQAFQQAVEEYKQSFRDINSLQLEYHSADEARREAINQELREVGAVGRVRMEQLVDAAIAAYKADPDKNPQVAQLLKSVAFHRAVGAKPRDGATGGNYIGGDQPELALKVVDTLVEGGQTDGDLYVIGALSALYTNNFEVARKYYELAFEASAFDDLPAGRLPGMELDPLTSYRLSAKNNYEQLDLLEAEWAEEAKIRAAEAKADDLPRVKFETTKGEIVIELFENEAPQSTANFLSLVKQGYYDGLDFHRVLPDFMAQGGDNGRGPGYTIRCECYQPNYRKHFRGSISMAKPAFPERDSGSAQFFLCFVPTKHLDGRHTAFGRIVEGIEVIGDLQKIDPSQQGPYPTPDKIIKGTVLRDRGHAYEFEKLPGQG